MFCPNLMVTIIIRAAVSQRRQRLQHPRPQLLQNLHCPSVAPLVNQSLPQLAICLLVIGLLGLCCPHTLQQRRYQHSWVGTAAAAFKRGFEGRQRQRRV